MFSITRNFAMSHQIKIPLIFMPVQAGFPSPADDFIETKLSLDEHLITNPPATFFVRVTGNSMIDMQILSGDLLIVDRSIEAKNNAVIVAILNGDFTVKIFRKEQNQVKLYPANQQFKPITIKSDDEFQVWGVVTYVVHKT